MKVQDLEKLLRSLPRQKASPEFTTRLLKKLDEEDPSSVSPRYWPASRPLLAAASALVLLGALGVGIREWVDVRERSAAARRVEALRNEYEALEKELQELRSLASDAQPVVELGGTEDVDILLDLRTLGSRTGCDTQAQPVDYRR